ncbi:MAG: pyrimidine/purine nucleoside phosphorylase [Candidatus Cloacimonadaceae bacterium]
MLKVNEYFDGKVKSIAFNNKDGNATVGVMEQGEYEFGTTTIEYMTIISGTLSVLLPGTDDWQMYGKGQTFTVPANKKFKVQAAEQTVYSCFYI